MKIRPTTRRFLHLELFLFVTGLCCALLAPLAESYRTRAFREAYEKLSRLPEGIADWRLADVAPPDLTKEIGSVQGNLNIVTAAYRHEITGEEVLLRVAHWYHPIRCYQMSGWELFRSPAEVLAGEEAGDLQNAGVREAHFKRPGSEMAVLFWEGSLTAPKTIRAVPVADGTTLGQAVRRQWLTLKRRIQRFVLRGPIVVEVVCCKTTFSASERDALIRLVRGLLRALPEVMS